jgi:phosphomannomutase
LKVSVSGIRGVVPQDLNPKTIIEWVNAFCNYLEGKKLLLSRDTRKSGKLFYPIVLNTALMTCKNVYSVSVAPTPTSLFIIKELDLDGGIIITASHNPENWNALKLAKKNRFLYQSELNQLLENLTKTKWSNCIGETIFSENAYKIHIDKIIDFVGLKITNSSLKIAIDCVNGAGYKIFPELVEKIGIKHIKKINCEDSGVFTRNPEPTKEHLNHLEALLDECDLVFATDPDGDRLVFGLKGFGILPEDFTVAVGLNEILKRHKGNIVVNYSTSIVVDFIAQKHNVQVIRSKVGEANVVEKIEQTGAVAGGEGNGGLIVPKFNPTRDGLLSMAFIISSYVEGDLTKIVREIPKTYYTKEKIENANFELLKESFISSFGDFESNIEDGLYLRKNYSWIHIRPSNTEHIIRVYAESIDKKFIEEIKKFLNSIHYK